MEPQSKVSSRDARPMVVFAVRLLRKTKVKEMNFEFFRQTEGERENWCELRSGWEVEWDEKILKSAFGSVLTWMICSSAMIIVKLLRGEGSFIKCDDDFPGVARIPAPLTLANMAMTSLPMVFTVSTARRLWPGQPASADQRFVAESVAAALLACLLRRSQSAYHDWTLSVRTGWLRSSTRPVRCMLTWDDNVVSTRPRPMSQQQQVRGTGSRQISRACRGRPGSARNARSCNLPTQYTA
jgi:hypothetical protein